MQRSLSWVVLVASTIAGSACADAVFHCSKDDECRDAGRMGVCAYPGYCAFEDGRCATELAYGQLAPDSLAGSCVPTLDGSSSGDVVDDSATPTSVDDGESMSAQDTSSSGGSPCAEGTPCEPVDPCALAGACDANGACEPTSFVVCDDPPGDCFEPIGECGVLGVCDYQPRSEDESCSDGDDCTIDTCDGAGNCVAGKSCPNDDPCLIASCEMGACVLSPVPDGTSCGDQASARCCQGACVDISSDTAHCGGCNTPCAAGLDCESISETSTCEFAPEATSGRCRCQFSNAQCPLGQLCRTVEPYVDRCVPPDSSNCDGVRFGINSCPSYCGYE